MTKKQYGSLNATVGTVKKSKASITSLWHPKKDTQYEDGRPGFDAVDQLFIDPVECIDWAGTAYDLLDRDQSVVAIDCGDH